MEYAKILTKQRGLFRINFKIYTYDKKITILTKIFFRNNCGFVFWISKFKSVTFFIFFISGFIFNIYFLNYDLHCRKAILSADCIARFYHTYLFYINQSEGIQWYWLKKMHQNLSFAKHISSNEYFIFDIVFLVKTHLRYA